MQDFKLDKEADLAISNGDFVIQESTLQHQKHILIAHKGEYKQHPEIGVGITIGLNDENPRALRTQIRRNFEYDGMQVHTLTISNDKEIVIDAPYKTI